MRWLVKWSIRVVKGIFAMNHRRTEGSAASAYLTMVDSQNPFGPPMPVLPAHALVCIKVSYALRTAYLLFFAGEKRYEKNHRVEKRHQGL